MREQNELFRMYLAWRRLVARCLVHFPLFHFFLNFQNNVKGLTSNWIIALGRVVALPDLL